MADAVTARPVPFGKISAALALFGIVILAILMIVAMRGGADLKAGFGILLYQYGQPLFIGYVAIHGAGVILGLVSLFLEGPRRLWGWFGLFLNAAVLVFG